MRTRLLTAAENYDYGPMEENNKRYAKRVFSTWSFHIVNRSNKNPSSQRKNKVLILIPRFKSNEPKWPLSTFDKLPSKSFSWAALSRSG